MLPMESRPRGTVNMKNPEILYQAPWCWQHRKTQLELWSAARAEIDVDAKNDQKWESPYLGNCNLASFRVYGEGLKYMPY